MAGQSEVSTAYSVTGVSASDPEKKETTVIVEAVGPSSDSSQHQTSQELSWEPGVKKRFPWIGLIGIITALLCNMAIILVLHFSHNTAASRFCGGHIAPNVFLTIFNSIANLAIAMAVGQGVAIAWWRRALKGRTVKELQYSWSFSSSISQIVLKFRYFNLIALAALATKITIVDSVLYQKSLQQHERTVSNVTERLVQFSSERLPYTGTMGQTPDADGVMTTDFSWDFYSWYKAGGAMTNTFFLNNCTAVNCRAGLPGAGFSVECTNTTEDINYGLSAPIALAQNNSAGHENLTLFAVTVSHNYPTLVKPYSSITLNITSPSADDTLAINGSCPTKLTRTVCELKPAVLNYTLIFNNADSSTLIDQKKGKSSNDGFDPEDTKNHNYDYVTTIGDPLSSDEWDQKLQQSLSAQVLQHYEVVEKFEHEAGSTLIGFYSALDKSFTSSVTVSYGNDSDWYVHEEGSLASVQMAWYNHPGHSCNITYNDPFELIVQQLNMLTFMTATDESLYYNWGQSTQDVDGIPMRSYYYDANSPKNAAIATSGKNQTIWSSSNYRDIFYVTNWHFVFGAAAATAVVIIFIIPVYWGFWELGRKVSLGPFEIANAFQSPAFSTVHATAGHTDEVIRAVGRNRFQYGEVVDDQGRRFVFQQV